MGDRVYKSDGSLCYQEAHRFGQICESETITWTDGNGKTVAIDNIPFMGLRTVTCASGVVAICSSSPTPRLCEWAKPSGDFTACEPGTCP